MCADQNKFFDVLFNKFLHMTILWTMMVDECMSRPGPKPYKGFVQALGIYWNRFFLLEELSSLSSQVLARDFDEYVLRDGVEQCETVWRTCTT